MVEITAENLGPIRKGSVKLKPLTVFVGPSNTGKSFMATAIHALVKAFYGEGLLAPRRYVHGGYIFTDRLNAWDFWGIPEDDSIYVEKVMDWVRQLEDAGLDPDDLTVADMPEELREFLNQSTKTALYRISQSTQEHLRQVWGESSDIVSKTASLENFRIVLSRDEPRLHLDFNVSDSTPKSSDFDIAQTSVVPSPLVLSPNDPVIHSDGIPVSDFEVFMEWGKAVAETILREIPRDSFYLPAARSGIVQGYRIMAAELVRRSSGSARRELNYPTLPSVSSEFLGNLISLDRRMLRHRNLSAEFHNALRFVENHVINGNVDLDESQGLASSEIVYLPTAKSLEGEKFTLDRSSSMVSELAPLILFLKYLVNPSDLLILEEPESHLHPAAQRRMARGIVRLVNAGVKVLLTTHSDYFLNQVNNLLRISYADEQWLEKHGFEESDCLQREDVSAYLFRWDDNQGGSLIEELTIRPDVGIDDDEFGKVVNDQYEETILVEGIPLK